MQPKAKVLPLKNEGSQYTISPKNHRKFQMPLGVTAYNGNLWFENNTGIKLTTEQRGKPVVEFSYANEETIDDFIRTNDFDFTGATMPDFKKDKWKPDVYLRKGKFTRFHFDEPLPLIKATPEEIQVLYEGINFHLPI